MYWQVSHSKMRDFIAISVTQIQTGKTESNIVPFKSSYQYVPRGALIHSEKSNLSINKIYHNTGSAGKRNLLQTTDRDIAALSTPPPPPTPPKHPNMKVFRVFFLYFHITWFPEESTF